MIEYRQWSHMLNPTVKIRDVWSEKWSSIAFYVLMSSLIFLSITRDDFNYLKKKKLVMGDWVDSFCGWMGPTVKLTVNFEYNLCGFRCVSVAVKHRRRKNAVLVWRQGPPLPGRFRRDCYGELRPLPPWCGGGDHQPNEAHTTLDHSLPQQQHRWFRRGSGI